MKIEPRYVIAILLVGVLIFVGFNENTAFTQTNDMCMRASQNYTISLNGTVLNDVCAKNMAGSGFETTTYVAIFVFIVLAYVFMGSSGKKMLTMREAVEKSREWITEQVTKSVINNCILVPQMRRVDIQGKPEYYAIGWQETSGNREFYVTDIDCWTGDLKSFKKVPNWDAEKSPDILIMAVPKEIGQVEIIGGNAKSVIDQRGDKK